MEKQNIEFSLNGREFIPLCDLLKTVGITQTGGHGKIIIAQGEVKVDGVVELRKRYKVLAGQVVELENFIVKVN